jgi:adenylate cyclase class IV
MLEIEHKYLVNDSFDKEEFFRKARLMNPLREFTSDVVDTYYFSMQQPGFVLRHRIDDKIQQLTIKGTNPAGNSVRPEINLELDRTAGNQQLLVRTFCQMLGIDKSAELSKQVRVFEFSDLELVYYEAMAAHRRVSCIEFEALERTDVPRALSHIEQYEKTLGFAQAKREHQSLFDLLIRPQVMR